MSDDAPASPEPQSMEAHKDLWSQHELLQTILSRHFNVHGVIGGTVLPAWNVTTKGDDDAHQQLVVLNDHLLKLGWVAKLLIDEPWVIQILPIPERQFPSNGFQRLMWMITALTLTLAGAYWMKGATPEGGWFSDSSLIDAFIGYTLPVLASVFIASHIQRYIAGRYGMAWYAGGA